MNDLITIEHAGAKLSVSRDALFQAWMEKHFPVAPIQGTIVSPVQSLTFPQLGRDDLFVGTIVRPDGSGHHIIRMAANPGEQLKWQAAMDYAAEQGGELPDRPEAALMFATARQDLESEWYWTRETHAGDDDYAWMQYFGIGDQIYGRKDSECRVVLVRRVPIEPFSH